MLTVKKLFFGNTLDYYVVTKDYWEIGFIEHQGDDLFSAYQFTSSDRAVLLEPELEEILNFMKELNNAQHSVAL